MEIHAMGIANKQYPDFQINRPDGSGDNLLLVFCNGAYLMCGGERITVPPDTAVVFSRGAPQLYGAVTDNYADHWIHFECDETDIFFDRIGLRFNEPFPAGDIKTAEKYLDMLSVENLSDGDKTCTDLILRLVMAKLCGKKSESADVPHAQTLIRLRAKIYSAPAPAYTVEGLARSVNLSPSYFQGLYRRLFGVSCYEDVLSARLALAKHYLTGSDISVSRISALCGFDNDVHFMRQFKKRTGMTPTAYRDNMGHI